MNPPLINRRQAISRIALIFGGAIVGSEAFLRGATLSGPAAGSGNVTGVSFTADDQALLDEIGDTIIPATNTPGAKAVGIGAFMAMMVNSCYDTAHQKIFAAGLDELQRACRARFQKSFVECSPAQRTELLNAIDRELRTQPKKANADPETPPHYFVLLKQLVLLGYFTSEIGATQALRYSEVPGAFRGNEPYKKGDRAWFIPPRALF